MCISNRDFRRAAFKKSSTVSESQVSIISSGQKDAVTLRSSDSAVYNSLRWWEKLLEFYTAPITKFWANVVCTLRSLVFLTQSVTFTATLALFHEWKNILFSWTTNSYPMSASILKKFTKSKTYSGKFDSKSTFQC